MSHPYLTGLICGFMLGMIVCLVFAVLVESKYRNLPSGELKAPTTENEMHADGMLFATDGSVIDIENVQREDTL